MHIEHSGSSSTDEEDVPGSDAAAARRRRPPPIVESEVLNDCKIGQTSLDARRAPSRTHRRNHPRRFLRHHRSTAPSHRRRVESPLRLRSRRSASAAAGGPYAARLHPADRRPRALDVDTTSKSIPHWRSEARAHAGAQLVNALAAVYRSDARHRVPALGASPHDSASVASIALRSPRSASARSTESIGRRARVEATTRREKRRRRRSRTSNSPAIARAVAVVHGARDDETVDDEYWIDGHARSRRAPRVARRAVRCEGRARTERVVTPWRARVRGRAFARTFVVASAMRRRRARDERRRRGRRAVTTRPRPRRLPRTGVGKSSSRFICASLIWTTPSARPSTRRPDATMIAR